MKTKWPISEARSVGKILVYDLAPLCDRIEIAGSIRRKKPMVSDIEVLYVPRFVERPLDLLSNHMVSLADEKIPGWLATGLLAKRPSSTGVITWGEKNKLGIHVPSGISVDFFATTLENWWVSLVIRTGSKYTNLALTNGAITHGGSLQAYGSGVMKRGVLYQARSERDVFDLCGLDYLEPENR